MGRRSHLAAAPRSGTGRSRPRLPFAMAGGERRPDLAKGGGKRVKGGGGGGGGGPSALLSIFTLLVFISCEGGLRGWVFSFSGGGGGGVELPRIFFVFWM